MFLLPFLKYFKPFTGRLLIAVVCMFLVGALSTVPLFIGREAMKVLVMGGASSDEDLSKINDLSHGLVDGASFKNDADVSTKTDAKKGKTTAAAKAEAKQEQLKSLLGRFYTVPHDWYEQARMRVQAKAKPFLEWYQDRMKTRPIVVLGFLSGILIVLILIKGVAEYASKYELSYTFFLTNLKIREDIFSNILRQDYLFFNSNSPGYLHSRINSDVKSVRTVLEGLIADGIQQPITIIFMLAFLMYVSMKLTIGVFVVMPFIVGLLYYFAKVLRKNTRKQKSKEDQLSSGLTESLNNIRLVKAFGTEELEISKYHERTMALFRYLMARRMAKFGSSPIMESLGTVAFSIVLLVGGVMIFAGGMKIYDFAAYLFALTRFYRPLRSLATLNTKYQEANVSSERMIEMLSLKPQLRDADDARPFEHLDRGIRFEQVGFKYDNKEILHGITLEVKAGQKVALAGPSGGGKTTLVNMLARLFDPSDGRILIDGEDLRKFNIADWRKHLAIVTQDTFLFDDTIENNIAYGTDTLDRERVVAAARAANAHDFILQLDGGAGYQTRIGPTGGRLSGGQRQRLAIARAIYRDPKILILDEATSALDAQSQAIVQEALDRLMANRTTFVIAHRISTIRNVDCIYVLDQGRIAEQGNHEELLAQGGLYYSMVTKVGLIKNESASDDAAADSPVLSGDGPPDAWSQR